MIAHIFDGFLFGLGFAAGNAAFMWVARIFRR